MNGRDSIIESLTNDGITNAADVVDYYIKHGIAKYDSTGKFSVSHGAYLDQDVLERASKQCKERAIIDDLLGHVEDKLAQ